MAKKKEIVNVLKIMAPGGTATPAPPLGPALGGAGPIRATSPTPHEDANDDRY